MGTDDSAETARHTFRQRSPQVLGGVCMLACLALFALSLSDPNLAFLGFMLLGVTVPFVFLVRPSLQVSEAGVHVNNPLRRTTVPWHLVDDCLARWNLQVHAGEQLVTSWAISSQIERQRPSGLRAFGLYGNPAFDAADSPPPQSVSAPGVARLITEAREEWDEAVADGTIVHDRNAVVVRTWQPLDIALLAGPALMILAGLTTG